MQRFAIWCPACGEVGVTEDAPDGDGAVACLYCGAGARWWPIDEAGEIVAASTAGAPPEFARTMIRQMSAAMR